MDKTGISKAVKWLKGDDCGCKERQADFNKEYNYNLIKCPTEDQYDWMVRFFARENKNQLVYADRLMLAETQNHIFGKNLNANNKCAGKGCWEGEENELKNVYESYG